MQDTERNAFQPPQPGGQGRSFALALAAHALLVLALTWGINWKNQPTDMSVTAELWSAVPREAAPQLQEPVPTPPVQDNPPNEPVKLPPEPKPQPAPTPRAPSKPAPEFDRQDAQIALKKEKAEREKKQREDKLREDRLREDKAKELKEKQRKEKEKEQRVKADKLKEEQAREEKEREKQKQAEKAKAEEKAKQSAEEKKRTEAKAKAKAQKEAQEKADAEKRSEADRQANIRRMQGMAGASGDENAKGTALKASGPSASYAGRIRARIKPNITFNDDVDGNPKAEVEVRVAPDGTILSRKLIQASGNKAWDEAVLKAIDKTETLPRDTDGRVQAVMVISFRPKD